MSTTIPLGILKRTSSLCPVCRRQIEAQVIERDGRVYMVKRCEAHGEFEVLINSDARFYYDARGAGCGDGCACGGHDPAIIERAATCIALIEIVASCNLQCPTCYADSPFTPAAVDALSLREFTRRIDRVLERKGSIDILQLSGGEPTIHPAFFELLERALGDQRIGYVLLNTNGVRLARDAAFMRRLGEMRARHSRLEVYLQFDGPQDAGQTALRGADLRAVRSRAIDACAEQAIPVTLAMTVTPANLAYLGDTLRFGLTRQTVRGITFQPMFSSGRTNQSSGRALNPSEPYDADLSHADPRHASPLNVADIILAVVDQSHGLLGEADFTPLPCGNPNCHTVGYLLRRGDRVVPVSRLIDFSQLQGFLANRVDFNMADLEKCGCESQPLGAALRVLEIGPDQTFRLFIKPFMDAWSYDQDRIDRCCVHVIGEGGKLESFCRHYAMK